jgi:hypothetical protein
MKSNFYFSGLGAGRGRYRSLAPVQKPWGGSPSPNPTRHSQGDISICRKHVTFLFACNIKLMIEDMRALLLTADHQHSRPL